MKVSRPVARGIRYLDQVSPGWELSVLPGKIDIISRTDCILGQVFGDVWFGIPPGMTTFRWMFWSVRHGFCHRWPTRRSLNKLTNEWRDYVSYRRSVLMANEAGSPKGKGHIVYA